MATKSTVQKDYDSNPFTLAFNSFGKFFKTNIGWAIALVALSVIGFVFELIMNLLQLALSPESSSSSTTSSGDIFGSPSVASSDTNVAAIIMIIVGVALIMAVVIVIVSAISTFITGMLSYVTLQSEQGKSVGFSEAWSETAKRFWRLYLASFLATLKIFGWTLLLIIPGIVAAFRYKLLPYVIMADSETTGVGSSHQQTKSLVKGRLMEVFGVATVAGIIPFVGSILSLTGNAALFTQLKAYSDANLEKPKVHWLNYIGFILLGILILFVGMIGLIVLAVSLSSSSL